MNDHGANADPPWTQFKLIQELIKDAEAGRPIIPLIGAGFSVESGIPTLSGLTRYLAKVQCYINHSVFSSGAAQETSPVGPRSYLQDPSSYIGDFGWPDPHRLNAELWTWVDRSCLGHRDYRRLLDQQVQADFIQDISREDPGLAALLKARILDPSVEQQLENLCESTGDKVAAQIREFLDLPSPISAARLLAQLPAEVQQALQALSDPPVFPELNLQGNWKTLLAHLINFNPDYVDTLFQSLLQGRQPGTTHRFLAFLTPILYLRLFLTVNFDDLLEQALRLEGLKPGVYEVSRDSPLPHPTLVKNELSVVKLHGGTFGLQVGEKLDQPLDENSKNRLERYLPDKAALLVMGVGGWDRRIRDLVEVVARRPGSSVYWMHFERDCPPPIQEMAKRIGPVKSIRPVRTHSTSAFLQELYYQRANSHPPSLHSYTSAIMRPVVSDDKEAEATADVPIHIFLNDPEDSSIGGSLRLARFVTDKAATHVPIWVDLEVMHTVEDVVAEIFRQVRKYDRWLSLTVLPTGPSPDDKDAVGKAVRRIYTALSRGRYVLAFNGVESFGRPPTYHHGTFKPDDKGLFWRLFQDAHRLKEGALAREDTWGPIKDSLLAFSVVPGEAGLYGKVAQSESQRTPSLPKIYQVYPSKPESQIEVPDRESEDFDALLLISAFRRRRSIVALRRLLGETAGEVDARLPRLEDAGYVKRLEGGHYWMSPRMRNKIYEIGQQGTHSDSLSEEIHHRAQRKKVSDLPLVNLSRLARFHASIAKFYYSELFVTSQEVSALLEHLYHRISALRYLTKLDAWLPYDENGELPSNLAEKLRHHLGISAVSGNRTLRRHLGELRLHHLRSIRTVLERETERLLSDIASDTLLGWIDWVRDEDLPRFVIDTCLRSARKPPAITDPGPRAKEIREECGKLGDVLGDLKAYALRATMDYSGWASLRRREVRRICGLAEEEEGSFQDDLSVLSPCLQNLSLERAWRVVRGVCDIWICLHRNGEVRYSDSEATLEAFTEFCSVYHANGGEESLWIEFLRCKADYGLIGLSLWAARTTSGQDQDVAGRCQWTIAACSEALERIDLLGTEDHARLKSYLHSLKAKAYYIQGRLLDAFPEIDLSQVGLAPRTGVNREILAIGLLRLAELLMARSEDALSPAKSVENLKWDLAVTSARRLLHRAGDTLRKVGEMLAGARQNVALWALLYQLRAQLQVEYLLLQSSEPLREDEGRRRFIEQLTQRLRIGLRAVRQGLDVVPPLGELADSPRNFHVVAFLRIWMELMVCGAYLTRREQVISIGDLWHRWRLWNQAAGIRRFDKTQPFFERLDDLFKPEDYGTGPQGRERVLAWIRDCVAEPSIPLLLDALSTEGDEWQWRLGKAIQSLGQRFPT